MQPAKQKGVDAVQDQNNNENIYPNFPVYPMSAYVSYQSLVPDHINVSVENLQNYLNKKILIWNINNDVLAQNVQLFQLPFTNFNGKQQFYEVTRLYTKNQLKIQAAQPNFDEMTEDDIYFQILESNEYNAQDSLTPLMLRNIRQSGLFATYSLIFKKNQVWKVHDYFIQGELQRYASLSSAFSLAHRSFNSIPARLHCGKRENSYLNFLIHPQIFNGILNILMFPVQLFAVVFGIPGWKRTNKRTLSHQEVENECQKWMEIQRQNKLRVKFNNDQNQFALENYIFNFFAANLQESITFFDQFAIQVKDQVNQQHILLQAQYNEYDPEYLNNITEQLYIYQQKIIKEQNKIPEDVQRHIQQLIKAVEIIRKYQRIYNEKVNQSISQIALNLKKNHSFLSKIKKWEKKQLNKLLDQEYQKLNQEKYQNIINEMKQNQLLTLSYLYEDYFQHQQQQIPKSLFQQMFQKLKRAYGQEGLANRIDPIVIVTINEKYSCYMNITSTYPFWKIVLFLVRLVTYIIKATIKFLKLVFNGPFGLKALMCCGMTYHNGKYHTVCSNFNSILNNIRESRDSFERQPDSEILCKCCTRIFNLIENYIIKFLICGVFGILILQTTLVIICSVFCLVMGLTAVAWVTILNVLFFLFQLIIVDLDTSSYMDHWLPLRIPFIMPLLFIICDFVILGVLQIVWACLLFGIQILLIIFPIVFGLLRFFFRTILDYMALGLLYCIGKVPQVSTIIAFQKKDAGLAIKRQVSRLDEINRTPYFTMTDQDVEKLIRQQLEINQLTFFNEQLIRQIQCEHFEEQYQQAKQIFKAMNVNYSENNYKNMRTQKEQLLIKILQKQIEKRKRVYPKLSYSNVRFQANTLEKLIKLTTQQVQQFVTQNQIYQIFQSYKVQENDWEELTKAIWFKAFDDQAILQPFEEIDKNLEYQLDIENQKIKIEENQVLNQFIAPDQEQQNKLNIDNLLNQDQNVKQTKVFPLSFVHFKDVTDLIKYAINPQEKLLTNTEFGALLVNVNIFFQQIKNF